MQKNIHRNRNIKHAGKPYLVLLCLLALIGINGCAQMIGMAIQEPVKQGAEWSSEGNYSFYVPDNYERDMDWPLVVLCHGEFPDSPKSHIHYWTNRAEAKGFIVAAPKLRSPHSFNTGNPESEIKKLREDERQILAVVKRLRGGYSISEDRVFIHGWSNGTIAALHTGLKHPDVFRGVSVVQPRFEGRFLADAANIIDYLQPVFVDYGSIDSFTGNHAENCLAWLHKNGANVQEHSLGPARADTNERTISFYERTIRGSTWMHVKAFQTRNDDPLAVRFSVKTTTQPVRFRWEFGDGDQSPVAEPIHVFPQEGTFRVRVMVEMEDGKRAMRMVDVQVPGLRVSRVTNEG